MLTNFSQIQTIAATTLVLAMITLPGTSLAGGEGEQPYIVGAASGFPPWVLEADAIGPRGLDPAIMATACDASNIECKAVPATFADCITRDQDGNFQPGEGLVENLGEANERPGRLDACLFWFATDERKEAGFVFSDEYSVGPQQVLVARPNEVPDYNQIQHIGYFKGFVNSPDLCVGLTPEMAPSSTKVYVEYDPNTDRDLILEDLADGTIDLFLWDDYEELPILPGGEIVDRVLQDGSSKLPIACSPDGLAMVTFPIGDNAQRTEKLLRKFNEGLDSIRDNGVMRAICNISQLEGGCILESD